MYMYIPQEKHEKVIVLYYDKDEDEAYHTIGLFTGREDEYEKYEFTCILRDGQDERQMIHKEDLYEDTEDNRDKIPQDIRLFYLSE